MATTLAQLELSQRRDQSRAVALRSAEAIARPNRVARALDSVIGTVSPGWAMRRYRDRASMAMAAYQAAEVSRLTQDWLSETLSGDQAVLPDMMTMNARARQGRRDDWAVVSICDSFRRDVVGTGITPRAIARDPENNEPLTEFNQTIDRLWNRWATRCHFCDRQRKQSLNELMGLGIEELVQVGNAFWVLSFEDRKSMVGLVLQMLEVEQLATEKIENTSNGNEIRGGVEIDEAGAPVAYWFHLGTHPLEHPMIEPTRVPADRVLQLIRQTRVRETLAPSRLSTVLSKARMLKGYDDSEVMAKRIESCIAMQLLRETGNTSGPIGGNIGLGEAKADNEKLTDARGNPMSQMEPGVIFNPPPGVKLELMNPQRPGGQYDMFTRTQVEQIAAGANRSYSTVARKFTASYTAERRGVIEDLKVSEPLQKLLIDQVLQPIREQFIAMALLDGLVKVPDKFLRDEVLLFELFETQWSPPPVTPIDPARSAAADKIELDERLNNRGDILNRKNKDWRQNNIDIAEQRDHAQNLGITYPEDAQSTRVSPNEPRPRGSANSPAGAKARGYSGNDLVDAILRGGADDEG